MSVRSTHPTACKSIWFISISHVKAAQSLPFIIASAELASPLIYLTSVICLRLWAYWRHITSIIRRFSWVVPNRIKQLYKDLKLVQSINRRLTYKILSIVDLIAALILKL